MKRKNLFTLHLYPALSFLLIFFTVVSCSDNSTGTEDPGEPPAVPESVPVEVESDYFNNTPETTEETEAYYEAAGFAQMASLTLMSGNLLGAGFLEMAESNEAEFNDGVWEWEYAYQQGGASLTIRVTAESVQQGYNWNVYMSGNFPQTGESVDEFRFLSGTVNSDGTVGEWNFYIPDQQSPILEYAWEILSETEYEASYTFTDPDEGTQMEISFERNGAENFISLSGDELTSVIEVYWNTDTQTGYIIRDGEQTCWDSNFEVTACS